MIAAQVLPATVVAENSFKKVVGFDKSNDEIVNHAENVRIKVRLSRLLRGMESRRRSNGSRPLLTHRDLITILDKTIQETL